MRKSIILPLLLSVLALSGCRDSEEKAAMSLARRVIPEQAGSFRFVHTSDTADVFSLESVRGKVVISGNNANSMAVGLNHYLQNYALTTVSWYAKDTVELPSVLPPVPGKVTVSARAQERFFLNYCTFGYTMPWWGWKEWERFIDWMALNGVTMPLAITGQEATWQKVWRRMGLTDEQIRAYFTGPAVLPWHRMMNLDRWLGPLPQEWIDSQAELQKQIVSRERELGMRPVLSAFSGHVPAEFKELHPEAKVHPVTLWDGFEEDFRCSILYPDEPLFARIQAMFLEEQEKMYGSDHIYGLDIFNEVDFFEGREWDPQELASISSLVYKSLSDADPDAVWLQMGWMFYHDSKHWTTENIEAYLSSVPVGREIILDYFCDKEMVWKKTGSFYGQPYYFCFLGNFGGNTNLTGDLHSLSARIEETFADGGDNLFGLGGTLEGFGVSQFLHEFMLSKAWVSGISDEQWISTLADRHCGEVNESVREAWKMLTDEIYTTPTFSGLSSVGSIHPCLEGDWNWTTPTDVPYSFDQILKVWEKMLETPSDADFYRFDIVNLGSETIKLAFAPEREALAEAFARRDIEAVKLHADNMRALFSDWERLLACHSTFSLREWIEQARTWGDTPEEKDYYERGARTVVTTWGGTGQLTDYANRQWSGLVSGYYAGRWELFFDALLSDLEGGEKFEGATFDAKVRQFELAFSDPATRIEYGEPSDPVALCREICARLKRTTL